MFFVVLFYSKAGFSILSITFISLFTLIIVFFLEFSWNIVSSTFHNMLSLSNPSFVVLCFFFNFVRRDS